MTEHSDHPHDTDGRTIIGLPEDVSTSRRIPFDVSRYLHFIDDPSLSEDEKRQMVEVWWAIVNVFADLGFGLHPAQQACGKIEKRLASSPGSDSDGDRLTGSALTNTTSKPVADTLATTEGQVP
jgi:hypothetical protein